MLALVADGSGDLRHARVRFVQQLCRALHAVLADVRGDGLPVNGLEDLLHRGGVHQEAARELVDGDAAGEVCGQRLVDAADGLKLLGAAPVRALERVRVERRQVRGGGDVLAFLGAGDLHGALDHAVQQLRLLALLQPYSRPPCRRGG